MVYNTQNYWVYAHRPSSGVLETREHNVRFEVSTAVTMMIIISQKMIIILENTTFRKLDMLPSSD
jgi:hypothetical protein